MEDTNTNIPALRFPEFKEEWKSKSLEEITDKISDGIHTTPNYDDDGKFYFINGNNLLNGRIIINEDTKRVNQEEYEKHKRSINENTILLSINGTIGNLAYYRNEPVILGKSAGYLNTLDAFDKKFIFYSLQTPSIQRFFKAEVTGSTIKNLSLTTIKNTILSIPCFPEQQKIANFLTAVDDKLQQLKKKKQLLEQYKKGVMHQLFTQQLRFADDNGNDYPDWQEREFGEAFTFINTNSLSRSQLNYQEGTIKNIHYGDIHMKYHSNFDIAKEKVPYINHEIDMSKINSEQYCKEGDLVIADASEDYDDIGKAIEIINTDNQKIVAGSHTYIARGKKERFAKGFLGYVMQTDNVRSQMMRIATGISVLGISKTNLSKIVIAFPSTGEQQKIASFLSSLDNKITSVQTQIQQTQTFKQGLLQQMFV